MDADRFVIRVRDHYVDQFHAFIRKQKRADAKGNSEIIFELGENNKLFRRIIRTDFVTNSIEGVVIGFCPENILTFSPINGVFGNVSLSIEQFRWDDVLLLHDAAAVPSEKLDLWFRWWFDLGDKRYESDAERAQAIHSLLMERGVLSIDFGTAEPGAFWDMLGLLEAAGARSIRVRSSSDETDSAVEG